MENYLTLEEFEKSYPALLEAKIDKDLEKLQKILDELKDKAKLDGEFSRWGTEMAYDSQKTGEVKVLEVIKGDMRQLIWRAMPGRKEEEFSATELNKLANYIIDNLKKG